MPRTHSIFLVDDHLMFREGVRTRLSQEPDFEIAGEAATLADALAQLEKSQPDIVVMDIRLPDGSGIELARTVRARWPGLKIVVLSGYDFDQYVRALVRIGIEGYLVKDSAQDDLVSALREVAGGGAVLPPPLLQKVMRGLAADSGRTKADSVWELTLRELEVLECLSEGLRNAEIAERLEISPRTVEAHVGSILSKLDAKSRTDAVQLALKRGLIK